MGKSESEAEVGLVMPGGPSRADRGDRRTGLGGAGAVAVGLVAGLLAAPAAADDLGLRVPPGFRVTLYADETLANDIYAMTLDAQGPRGRDRAGAT